MELERWEWVESKLTELGAPDDLPRVLLTLDRTKGDRTLWRVWSGPESQTSGLAHPSWRWPKSYGEYLVRALGVVRPLESCPVDGSCFLLRQDGYTVPAGADAIEIYLQMAYRDKEPVVSGELQWYPEKGVSMSAIRGADQEAVTLEDVNHAWRALRFLCQLPLNVGGRPKGTGTYTSKEDAERAIRTAVKELGDLGIKPTQHDVARHLIYSNERALRHVLKRWGLDWNELRKG
jgi:hypothetical protein